METIVTLKESFAKRRILADCIVPAEVKISNGKEFIMYFMLEKRIIEVTHKPNDTKKEKLTKEERISIIETILEKYTSFFKSIINLTISYYIEDFHFVDTTTIDEVTDKIVDMQASKDTLLKEYLESGYGKNSVNKLFRVLDGVYAAAKKNSKDIKHNKFDIKIEYSLNFEQRWDLKYFTKNIISILELGDIEVNIDKERSIIHLEPKN